MHVVVFKKTPYGTSFTGEGIRVLSSLGAFEVECSVLFTDDGVFALVKDQNPEELEMKSLGKAVESLSGVVKEILVSEESLKERGIQREDLIDADLKLVNRKEIHGIITQCKCILTF